MTFYQQMKHGLWLSLMLFVSAVQAEEQLTTPQKWQLLSPDQQIRVELVLSADALTYQVSYRGKAVLKPSVRGLVCKGQPPL